MKSGSAVPQKAKYIWNMIGSLSSSLSSFVLLTVVTRFNGSDDGGAFSLAYSTAQLLVTIGNMEIRPIQSTDIEESISFKDYYSFRVLSCLIMMLGTVGYILYGSYDFKKSLLIFLICSYKMIESMSDVFEGMFQQKDRIDLSGMSLAIRVIVSTLVFITVLWITNDLIISSFSLFAASALVMIAVVALKAKKMTAISFQIRRAPLLKLLCECFPLFLGAFIMNYICNAPKYAIDRLYDDQIQNYFGFLFMPAFVINLLGLLIFRPMLVTLAISWNGHDIERYVDIIRKAVLLLTMLTFLICLGAYLLGIPVLNLISGLKLDVYRKDLVIIMLGGGLSAFISVFYCSLTVMRKQSFVLVSYGVGFAFSILFTKRMVKAFGITGASAAYTISTLCITVVMLVVLIFQTMKNWDRT